MLVITRKQGQKVRIGPGIVIHLSEVHGRSVRLKIEAPGLQIFREEVYLEIAQSNAKAAGLVLEEPLTPAPSDEPSVLQTTRFGTLTVEPEEVIQFPEGLVGFPEAKRFVVVKNEPDSPFRYLQSVDFPALALRLVDLPIFYWQYEHARERPLDRIAEEFRAAGGLAVEGYTVGAIVTPGANPADDTINLLTPIVVGLVSRLGRQCVLYDGTLSPRHPLVHLLAQQDR